jgi:hypothetical protein
MFAPSSSQANALMSIPAVGFAAATMITCKVDGTEQQVAVEDLRKGTLVKTSLGFKAIDRVGSATTSEVYTLSKETHSDLTADLTVTGDRCLLVDMLTDAQRDQIVADGKIRVVDKKFSLPVSMTDAVVAQGETTVYNFSLEHSDKLLSRGVYANGLLVDHSCILHMMMKGYEPLA